MRLFVKLFQIAVIILFCALICIPNCFPINSAGSENLNENGGYRAYLEYYCDGTTTAGLQRKTYVNVFLKKGEVLYLGSSVNKSILDENDIKNSAVTGSDIVLVKPDGTKLSFDVEEGQGYISSVQLESAGPNIDGTNESGFTPISFTPTEEGIYQIHYHSTTGDNQNPTPKLTTEQWAQSNSTVGSWNATVVGADGKIKTGRTYTRCLCLNMGGNIIGSGASAKYIQLNSKVYVVTTDGYIYHTEFNGMNPYGFIFFANNRGLVSVSNNYTLYKSYVSKNNELSDFKKQDVTYHNPWDVDTDMDKTFDIFFEKPDPELEGVLYPTAYEPETAKNLSFIGSHGDNQTHIGYGGYFKFDITNATSATITIDLTHVKLSDDIYADYGIVQLNNPVTRGTNYFYWDGNDSTGTPVPVGTYDNNSIKVTVETHSGEYHFPLFDVEMATNGIKVTRVNKINRESTDENGNIYNQDVSASYDDKKAYIYYNNSQKVYGYDNRSKCIADDVDASAGIDSSDGAMKFGLSGNDYKGDQTALDIWTYSNAGKPLITVLSTPIIINDDKYSTLTGRVFYDKTYTDLNASNNTFDLSDGDYMLGGVNVSLKCTYTNDDGKNIMFDRNTVTNSGGCYYFTGIPVMEGGNLTSCTVTVTKPLTSYEITTENTITNSSSPDNQTYGTEIQTVSLGGLKDDNLNYIAKISLSDVGYHYALINKSITVKKDWITNISSDNNRPKSVSVRLRSYYYDNDNKIEASVYTYILSNSTSWETSVSNLPAYYDTGSTKKLYYEFLDETYTMRSGESYTFASNDSTASYPYSTSFNITDTLYATLYTVTNAPKQGTMEITKRDEDDLSLLLDNVAFTLFRRTFYDSIPEGQENLYKDINGVIYEKINSGITNQNGKLVFTGLGINDYFVAEVTPKAGYQLDTKLYYFNITGDNLNQQLTVYNHKLPTYLTVIKTVDKSEEQCSVPITVMYSNDSQFNNPITIDASITAEPQTLSYIALDEIEIPRDSYVKIIEGDSVYQLDPSTSYIYDNTLQATVSSIYASGQIFTAEGGHSYTVNLSNIKTIINSYSMQINKVDGNTGKALTGAEFSLFSDPECTELIIKKETLENSDQKATANFMNLSPGTYYLKETSAPPGYLLPSDVKKIIIYNDNTVTVDNINISCENYSFSLTVANYLGIVIPQSGVSLTNYSIITLGLFLCLLALVIAIGSYGGEKRKKPK